MNCSRVFLRVMFFSIAVAISGSASAADIRYPEKGDVAFIVHLPDGWTTNPDTSGNLLLMAPDHSAALSLTVVRSKSDFEANPEAEANGILAAAKAEPFSRHEPSSIGSLKAEAYYSKLINATGVNVLVKLNMIQLAPDYLVTESILTQASGFTDAKQKALDAAVAGISVVGAK